MKAMVIPTLLSFNRTRAWTQRQLVQSQQLAKYAVRKAIVMDTHNMQEEHIHDKHMYEAAGWESIEEMVQKASMWWLGHVPRMNIDRRPKQALFGWWAGHAAR